MSDNQEAQQKSAKEIYDERRKLETKEKDKSSKLQKVKKTIKVFIWTILLILILGGGGWYAVKSGLFSFDPLNLCVQHTGVGMHIHTRLKIFIKGEEFKIPANVGVTAACMRPVHTHDESGTLHLEFPNKTNVALGAFFKIWEKPLSEFGINPKMKVNSAENNEFENYIMRDGDQIELFFD